jgi:hypothetical protein
MKWILPIVIAFTVSLYASTPSGAYCTPPKVQQCSEEEPDLFKQNDQIYSGSVEFLYWTVAEGALDYAIKMQRPAWSDTSPSYAQGQFATAGYGPDPGVRLGFHYFRAPHYWELKWQYTRMTSNGHDSIEKPAESNEFLTGTWPQISPLSLTQATSHIHLNYNVFDMLIDRVFFPNPHLRLRLVGGAIITWMNQDWKVRYFDAIANTTTIRNRWSFAGGGLKLGSVFDWYLTWDLYMTGTANFGVLIGDYTNKAKQTTTVALLPQDNTDIPVRNATYNDIRSAFTSQLMLGPSWQKNFCNSRVEVFAGFEMNIWFNLQEIYRSTSGIPSAAKETWLNSGMLAFYGLTTRVTADF